MTKFQTPSLFKIIALYLLSSYFFEKFRSETINVLEYPVKKETNFFIEKELVPYLDTFLLESKYYNYSPSRVFYLDSIQYGVLPNGVAGGKGITVTLAANKVFGIVERVYRGSQILPYATYFDTFERLMNSHKLDIVDFGQTPTGVFVSTKSVEDEFKIGNFGNEVFHPGFTLTNNLSNGLVLDSYLYRLICTNGMVGQSFGHSIKYNPESMTDFFKSLIEFKNSGLIPLGFRDKVTQAIHTKASYAEVHSAAKIITNNSKLTIDLVDRFVPVNDIRRKFALKGADTVKWNSAQEKNAITNISVWDVVNGLTDFASHDYGFDVKESDRLSMQKQAGDLLGKPAFDTQNLVHVSL